MDGSLGVGEDPCPPDDAPDSWYRYSVPHTKEEEKAAASAKSVTEAEKKKRERKGKTGERFKRHKEQKPRRQVMSPDKELERSSMQKKKKKKQLC